MADIQFVGYGGNLVGSLSSGSLVQNMPSAYSFGTADAGSAGSFVDCGDRAEFEFPAAEGHILSTWVKMAKFSDHQFIAGKSNWAGTSHSEYLIGMNNDGRFHWVCNNGSTGGTCQSNDVYNNDVDKEGWNHIMGVRDTSNNMTLYINGVAQTDTETCTGDVGVSSQDFGIGTRNSGGTPDLSGDYWRGNIRDVRIYSGSATAGELQQIFEGNSPTLAGGSLVGWWKMGGDFNDFSGNAFNGTLTTGADSTDYWDGSVYNLNQIGVGSVSGSATVSGGTWNLRDSTYLDFNGSSGYASVPSAASLDEPKTIAFWARPDAIQVGANNIVSRGANDFEIYFHSSTNTWWNYYGNKYSVGADGPPVGVGVWQHIVSTIDDTTSPPTHRWYKDGELFHTGPLNGTPAYGDDGVLNIGRDATEENDYFDGIIKDLILYDTRLTDAQIGLLYKGQWVGSPEHWWKLNEGTGNGEDSGVGSSTATPNNTTWVNPTFNLDGRLTITANGTVSAPKGDFDIDENFQNYGTFTHNSGTVVFTAGDNSFINTEGTVDPVFYNVTSEKHQLRFYNDVTIERQLQLDAAASHCYIWANKTLTMGSTTSPETGYPKLINNMNDGDKQFWFYAGSGQTATLQGVSELYPIIFTKAQASADIEWGYHASSAAQIKNIDFQFDIETDTSDTLDSIKLTGDCEFDKLTISNGDRINLNGQRVKFGDDFTVNSGGHNNGAGLIFAEGDYTENGTGNGYTTKTLVMDGGYCNPAQTTWKQMFLRDGTHTIGGSRDWGGTPIIIAGTSNFTSNNTWGNITIPAGGILSGNSAVITSEGDFNMAGGLIGTSALTLNGAGEYAAKTAASTMGISSIFSIEFWFNTTFNGSSTVLDIAESSGNGNRIQVLQTPSEMAFKLYNAGGSSYQIGTTAFTINPDDGKWHHLAFTTDGSTQKIYYDGKLAGQASHTITRDTNPSVVMYLGKHATLGGNFFGSVDEFRIWSDVRDVDEIRDNMFAEVSDSASGLVQYLKFNQGTGSTASASVGNSLGLYDGGSSADDLWAAPGSYAYNQSTLKFNKAGTCNLYGHQDGTSTNLYSLTVTNGTTLESFCESNDFIINSGATLVNSGTLNSNRNWQYKSPNMPIVGASSDLKVGNNIFYYFPPAVSGAATEYRSLQPGNGVDLYMQGDFTAYSLYPYSDAIVHFNGHKGTVGYAGITSYASGNVVLEPGSSINFNDPSLRGFYQNAGGNNSYIIASGEACAIFPGGTDGGNEIDLPAGVLESLPQSSFSISMWVNVKDDDYASYTGFFGGTPGKQFSIWRQSNDRIMFAVGGNANQFSIFPTVTSGDWFHIGMTYDGSTVKGYYNGTQTGSTSYAGAWTTSVSTIGAYAPGGTATQDGKMADVRIFPTTLSDANFATLASENPATSVSGAYADPTNSLGAISWHKLGATPTGTLDASNFGTSGATFNGSIDGNVTSGFVAVSGNAGFGAMNKPYEKMTLTNMYISGMADVVVGQTSQGANVNSTLITKGTVTLE